MQQLVCDTAHSFLNHLQVGLVSKAVVDNKLCPLSLQGSWNQVLQILKGGESCKNPITE